MGQLGYLALEELDPGAAFPGVIGRTTDGSGPAWLTGRRCPRRVAGVGTGWMYGYGRWGSGDSRLDEGAVFVPE
jgi:hypothetical protein